MASSPASSELSSFSSSPSPPPGPIIPVKRSAAIAFRDDHDHDNLHHDYDAATEDAPQTPSPHTPMSDISSDTSGSVPGTPREDDDHGEQVTVCRWERCGEDLGNMDDLVKHIHDEHIGSRRAKYACEWDDCIRKGMPHASGYALKAHMRSHTREKPFYCTLPECDRSFTRSDALAKHMRTVHETEALRPSDPIPKSHPNHPLNISAHLHDTGPGFETDAYTSASPSSDDEGDVEDTNNPGASNGVNGTKAPRPTYYEPEDGFSKDEMKFPPAELYRYLRRKLKWAEEEKKELMNVMEGLEEIRRQCWIKKEMMLEMVLDQQLGPEVAEGLKAPDVNAPDVNESMD